MSLKIHSVVNGKTPNEEFVWLNSSETVNLKGYALVDRTFDASGEVSNEFRHIFIFPDQAITKDDWVRVYTGAGTNNKIRTSKGNGFIYNFYWGAKECVWNNLGGDRATLIRYVVVNEVNVPAVK